MSAGPGYGTADTRMKPSSEPKERKGGERGSMPRTCGSLQHTTITEEKERGKERSSWRKPERNKAVTQAGTILCFSSVSVYRRSICYPYKPACDYFRGEENNATRSLRHDIHPADSSRDMERDKQINNMALGVTEAQITCIPIGSRFKSGKRLP